ncbi:MAG: type II toxin-antitoxin system ParD family antitoxin, partial [Nostoc sp.]
GYQQWVGETREKVEVAIEQLDRGEGIDGDVVVEQLREKLRKAREAQG